MNDSLELAALALKEQSFPHDHVEVAESLAGLETTEITNLADAAVVGMLTTNEKWMTIFRESSLDSEEDMIRQATELLGCSDVQVNLRRERDGATAFSIACDRGFGRLAKLILSHPQFDDSCCTKAGHSPMASASMNGLVEVVQALLSKTPSNLVHAPPVHFTIVCSECGSNHQGLGNEFGSYSACTECSQEDSVFCPLVA